jgi:hypothetical protein
MSEVGSARVALVAALLFFNACGSDPVVPMDDAGSPPAEDAGDRPDAGAVLAPGLSMDASGFVTTEIGQSVTITVSLTAAPSADVVVPIASSDETEGSLAIASVTFTPADWEADHAVMLTGVDDAEIDGHVPYHVVLGPTTSDDPEFAGLELRSRDFMNVDNESAAILASAASSTTSEAGGRANFTVRLAAPPSSEVMIALVSDDPTEGTIVPPVLHFDAATAHVPQAVTVIGVDDAEADGSQEFTVSFTGVESDDASYREVALPPPVTLTNVDDDTAGVTLEVDGTTTTEIGGTASFTVVLNSAPTSDVTIGLTSSRPAEGVPNTSMLRFTPSSWSTPQEVVVTGQDDGVADGNRTYAIVLGRPRGDTSYASLEAPPPVDLVNIDDDVAPPVLRNRSQVTLALSSQTTISYGGYLNGESFQQDGILTYDGYQYAAYWNTGPRVILARRAGGVGEWAKIELDPDYTGRSEDAHNTISLGVSPSDGRLHVSFDHHGSELRYVRSVAGLVDSSSGVPWETESFEARTNRLGGLTITQVTYPRFITLPDGRLLFEYRYGASGSGDQILWEYEAGVWTQLGAYIRGIAEGENAYPHSIEYHDGRLHVTWCWRESSDAATNHDLLYIYSDDDGRTWRKNDGSLAGTTATDPIEPSTAGIVVWPIAQRRGLINQEHMIVDAAGRVHVLLSHMPDSEPDLTAFTAARARSQFFHYWRDTDGRWTRMPLGLPVQLNFRGKLAVSSSGNLYAVLPNIRVASASASALWTNWSVIESEHDGEFFSDPLIDRSRLRSEDVLTVFAPIAPAATVSIETINYDIE